jgi:hypothetical protein
VVAVDSLYGGVRCCFGDVVELLVLDDSACDICSGEGHAVLLLGCDAAALSLPFLLLLPLATVVYRGKNGQDQIFPC